MNDEGWTGRHEEFYQAFVTRDSQYRGIFVAGVKTTGIFCVSTCTARKPHRKNVEFFPDGRAALLAGYRPCRICNPTRAGGDTPEDVRAALRLIADSDAPRVRDVDLRAIGLLPSSVRRWFKRYFGMTFQAYQRMLRLNASYQALKEGSGVLEAGLVANYESASGFYYAYERAMRESPAARDRKTLVTLTHLETPLGPMLAGATAEGLCLLEFTDRRMLETQLNTVLRRLDAVYLYGDNDVLRWVGSELRAYFDGTLQHFTVPLVMPGTPFQQQVWEHLRTIPYGATRSYAQQALATGRPTAVRAVAAANGRNRIAIVVPCHRVIGSDGTLTGYGGGIARKEWLLNHEQRY
ncbi:MAG: methylated-DNA--[protein]-cysteine S-methyltransferase [Alkalispirochaeta sp.]